MSYEIHIETIDDLTIRILIDENAQNPFDDWDCEPPLAVNAAYNHGIEEYSVGYGNVNTPPTLTREQIKANLPSLLRLAGCTRVTELAESRRDYADIVDCINDALSEHLDTLSNSDRLESLCDLYKVQGIPAVVKSIHGSSQGDYAEVLAVATLEFQASCGNAPGFDWVKCLEGSIQLFRDWAFGNVYGYVIEGQDGEQVDSCWGFFGDYDNEFGALSEAIASVKHIQENARKTHLEQVKAWIKNRVPLNCRTLAV